MDQEFLGDRRKALEESFFVKENERLRAALNEKRAAEERKAALADVSGITDDAVLSHLDALDIGCDTLTALSLIPVVAVAWADGKLDDQERTAILDAAHEVGIHVGSPAAELLQSWLAAEPGYEARSAWKEYVAALCKTMDEEKTRKFKQGLLARSRAVADASGGIIGLGSKISTEEKSVLEELERAFS